MFDRFKRLARHLRPSSAPGWLRRRLDRSSWSWRDGLAFVWQGEWVAGCGRGATGPAVRSALVSGLSVRVTIARSSEPIDERVVNLSSQPGAVVLNGSPTGLCAVRSLGRQGIPTAVVHTKSNHIAAYSRWASEHYALPEPGPRISDPLRELLARNVERWRGRVLLPSCDRTLTVLSRHRDELSRSYRVPVPAWEITRRVLQKDLTYAAARDVGVDIPRDYGPASVNVLQRDDIVYPVLVKPLLSHEFVTVFGQKLFVARDRDELARAIGKLNAADLEARVVDLIPGPDSLFYNYTFLLDDRGDPVAEFGFRKLRKSPPRYGVGRVAVCECAEELREPTLELLRRLNWTGVASAEYKLDPRDGRFRLMEVNGRFYLTMGLAARAGVDYPFITWAIASGQRLPPVRQNGWRGAWIDLRAEFVFSLFFREMDGLAWRETLAPYRTPKTFAVWSASDPKPFVAAQLKLAQGRIGAFRTAAGRAGMQRRLRSAVPG